MNGSGQQRVRRITDFGEWKEVENYLFAPMLGNHSKRCAKSKETVIAVAKNNDRHTVRQVENKIKANFKPRDWFLTLTYSEEHKPQDEKSAKKNIRNFHSRTKRLCDKLGIDYKYLVTTELGERSGRWHHHIVLPGRITYEQLEKLWYQGAVNPKRLWADNNINSDNDMLNVHRLAEYFVGVNKTGKMRDDRVGCQKRYSFSRNCIEPKVTYEVMSPKWMKCPRIPRGWKIAAGSLEEYCDSFGMMHQRYIIVKKE